MGSLLHSLIEALLNQVGAPGTFALAVCGLTVPMLVAGRFLRTRGRREQDRWGLIDGARVALRDLRAGRAVVAGTWRNLDADRALLEDGDAAALILRASGAPRVEDGTNVLVVGWAMRQVDLLGTYRHAGRTWTIEGDGSADPLVVSRHVDLPRRSLRAARTRALVGAGLIALGVAAGVSAAAVCSRAAASDGSE
jgi:hypothetical protein